MQAASRRIASLIAGLLLLGAGEGAMWLRSHARADESRASLRIAWDVADADAVTLTFDVSAWTAVPTGRGVYARGKPLALPAVGPEGWQVPTSVRDGWICLEFRAPGRALAARLVDARTPGSVRMRVEMTRAASITGRVVSPDALPELRVRAAPHHKLLHLAGYALRESETLSGAIELNEQVRAVDCCIDAEVGRDSDFRIDGLTAGVPMHLVATSGVRSSASLAIVPGSEGASADLLIDATCELVVRVVGEVTGRRVEVSILGYSMQSVAGSRESTFVFRGLPRDPSALLRVLRSDEIVVESRLDLRDSSRVERHIEVK